MVERKATWKLWKSYGMKLDMLTWIPLKKNLRDQATRLEKVGGNLPPQDQTLSALNHGLPITSWNSQKSVEIPDKMLFEPANFFFGRGGGGRVGASVKVGVSLLHRHRAISWHAFWVAWLNSRGRGGGGGGVGLFKRAWVVPDCRFTEISTRAYSFFSKLSVAFKLRGVCV